MAQDDSESSLTKQINELIVQKDSLNFVILWLATNLGAVTKMPTDQWLSLAFAAAKREMG